MFPVIRTLLRKASSKQCLTRTMSSKGGASYLRDNMSWLKPEEVNVPNVCPDDAEVVIIGGGIIGCSIAYFLKRDELANANVVVIEKDDMYTRASTVLSVGGIRQQFSNPENILLSLHSANFLKNARELLCVGDQDPPEISFNQQGYFLLASENGAETLLKNHEIQKNCGASVELLTKKRIKERFPWINTDGIELGSYGVDNEGWFDPWCLLRAMRTKAMSLGVNFINANVTGFQVTDQRGQVLTDLGEYSPYERRVTGVEISYPNSPSKDIVKSPVVVLATGHSTSEMGLKLGIGRGSERETLNVGIPVCPRKRYVYVVHCPAGPTLDCPFLVDPSGFYFRREGMGGNYLVGRSPDGSEDEPSCENLDVDYDYFEQNIWEALAHRVPAFEELKIKNAWAGFYDYNTFDQNAILGYHTCYKNLIIASGFSGHGIQQAPAVGQCISELILYDETKLVDVRALGFERIVDGNQMLEKNII